eukprot:4554519-Ditylum_brightwellii.AAC.1
MRKPIWASLRYTLSGSTACRWSNGFLLRTMQTHSRPFLKTRIRKTKTIMKITMMPLNTRSNAICDWRGRLRVLWDKFMQQALRTMTYHSKISLSVKEK